MLVMSLPLDFVFVTYHKTSNKSTTVTCFLLISRAIIVQFEFWFSDKSEFWSNCRPMEATHMSLLKPIKCPPKFVLNEHPIPTKL